MFCAKISHRLYGCLWSKNYVKADLRLSGRGIIWYSLLRILTSWVTIRINWHPPLRQKYYCVDTDTMSSLNITTLSFSSRALYFRSKTFLFYPYPKRWGKNSNTYFQTHQKFPPLSNKQTRWKNWTVNWQNATIGYFLWKWKRKGNENYRQNLWKLLALTELLPLRSLLANWK